MEKSGALDKTPAEMPSGKAERRHLSVVFCDLVGSTALSTQVDPEELADFIGQYQRACADAIVHFDGFVARYLGDGVLAYFGYPLAHEDDAERAVHAALAVVEAVGGLPRGWNAHAVEHLSSRRAPLRNGRAVRSTFVGRPDAGPAASRPRPTWSSRNHATRPRRRGGIFAALSPT
jgi:class 3 adenylate cyclase